jgi:AraC-like DNA-binding protein
MNLQSVQRKPETLWAVALGDRQSNGALARAKQFIDDNFREALSLDRIADFAGLGRFTLAKQFRQYFGVTPHRYLCAVRVRHAQYLMENGLRPSDIANEVGFFDQSHLIRHFKRACGMTPRQYMSRRASNGQRGKSVRLASVVP